MTLKEMCEMAARYSDRYDEFEKTENSAGKLVYEDDALHYFNVFRDAINEAYFEVSRMRMLPDTYAETVVPADRQIDLSYAYPLPYMLKNVLSADRSAAIAFQFVTRMAIEITGAQAGDTVTLYYYYMPDRLEYESDEPIFPESVVDPMVYVTLAVARMWQSEKKMANYQTWMGEYLRKLKGVQSSMKNSTARRIPRLRMR